MAFACLALPQLVWFLPALVEADASRNVLRPTLDALTADSLPEQRYGWRQAGFQVAERGANRFFGDVSRTWSYQHHTLSATLSVDYPFAGWHELTLCYRRAGWGAGPLESRGSPGTFFVPLEKPLLERGSLWFAIFDWRGQPLVPEDSIIRERIAARPEQWRRRLTGRGEALAEVPSFQVQLLIEHPVPLSSADQASAEELFLDACDRLLQPFRAAPETQP